MEPENQEVRTRGRSRSFISEEVEQSSGDSDIPTWEGAGGDDNAGSRGRTRSRSVMSETEGESSAADMAARAASISQCSIAGGQHLGGVDYDPSKDTRNRRDTGLAPVVVEKTGSI